jgi:TRAP-type mannitol/chloroaromatic compound transport system permease small subunit
MRGRLRRISLGSSPVSTDRPPSAAYRVGQLASPAAELPSRSAAALIRLIGRTTSLANKAFAWLVVPLVLALCYEVVARYVLGQPTIWAFDITYMLMSAIFLAAAADTLASSRHIRIDVFYADFSPRTRAWVDLIGYTLLFLPVIALLAWFAAKKVFESIVTGETSDMTPWHPLMWPFRAVIALCFGLLLLQGICEALKSVLVLKGRR